MKISSFFKPFLAARFRLRFAPSSGREEPKKLLRLGARAFSQAWAEEQKFFASFFQKRSASFPNA
jgi:hypothetical protein